MSTTPDKLVERYLKHLEVELDDLPRDRRREIVDEIAGHIAEARAGLEHETQADVRNILEGLGDPADIAESARERFDVQPARTAPPSKPSWIEVGALVMLLAGGLILPIAGWFVGLVLLWVSNAWNIRDKIIGTVFWPGGLALPLFLYLSSSQLTTTSCSIDPATGRQFDGCSSGPGAVAVVLAIVVLATPFVTTAYLAYRLRRRPAAATA